MYRNTGCKMNNVFLLGSFVFIYVMVKLLG